MEKKKLCDVSLASTDGSKFEAHKGILSAHSYVLKNIMVNKKQPHPFFLWEDYSVKFKKQYSMNYFMQLSTNMRLVEATSKD